MHKPNCNLSVTLTLKAHFESEICLQTSGNWDLVPMRAVGPTTIVNFQFLVPTTKCKHTCMHTHTNIKISPTLRQSQSHLNLSIAFKERWIIQCVCVRRGNPSFPADDLWDLLFSSDVAFHVWLHLFRLKKAKCKVLVICRWGAALPSSVYFTSLQSKEYCLFWIHTSDWGQIFVRTLLSDPLNCGIPWPSVSGSPRLKGWLSVSLRRLCEDPPSLYGLEGFAS